MPPKKFLNLTRLKNSATESKGDELKKQCTISKFFTKSRTVLKPDEDVTVLIDESEDDFDSLLSKEKKVNFFFFFFLQGRTIQMLPFLIISMEGTWVWLFFLQGRTIQMLPFLIISMEGTWVWYQNSSLRG